MAVTGLVREILHVLGTGGTVEMAQRVQTWQVRRDGVMYAPGIQPDNLVGSAGVARMLGWTSEQVARVVDDPGWSFPAPVARLDETPVWDREQVQVWLAGHDGADPPADIHDLIEASSLGEPDAKAARERVPVEEGLAVVRRAAELGAAGVPAAVMRAWCVEHGVSVPAKGRLPQPAVDAYMEAHS